MRRLTKFHHLSILTLLLLLCAQLVWPTEVSFKYWIFFQDKGPHRLKKLLLDRAAASLTSRALYRRAKVAGARSQLVDFSDIDVFSGYVERLEEIGVHPLVVSKWVNAVTAVMSPEQTFEVKSLPFVTGLRRVAQWRRENRYVQDSMSSMNEIIQQYDIDYGPSLHQNELIRVPEVHELGIHGEGVLIGVFDSGFQLQHEAFNSINVVAQWDFINKDSDPSYNRDQDISSQYHHGTEILSIIGGYAPGQLIGPAFGAEFILAKTEDISSETIAEEDNWIAAAEWVEALGADIITSSVGYMDWYTTDDMDGNTAPITIAADLAVKKGIVVCNSAGNEGSFAWRTIIAPADGDSVIAVGGVNSEAQIWRSSSRGPTADGRIKPDVLAQSTGVYSLVPPVGTDEPSLYGRISGTSASCPQVAGVAALVLSAHPELTPIQVREALRQTADHALAPDNDYGWGVVDAVRAIQYWGPPPALPHQHRLLDAIPNPFNLSLTSNTVIRIDLASDTDMTLAVYNLLGQKVRTLWDGPRMRGANQRLTWYGTSDDGTPLPSGVYLFYMKIGNDIQTTKLTLLR